MKIAFNPLIKNNYQPSCNKSASQNKSFEFENRKSVLECIANYNIPFCSREVIVVHYDGSYEQFSTATAAKKNMGQGFNLY